MKNFESSNPAREARRGEFLGYLGPFPTNNTTFEDPLMKNKRLFFSTGGVFFLDPAGAICFSGRFLSWPLRKKKRFSFTGLRERTGLR